MKDRRRCVPPIPIDSGFMSSDRNMATEMVEGGEGGEGGRRNRQLISDCSGL